MIADVVVSSFNRITCKDNYGTTSNNMKLVHWPLMGGLLHLVREWYWAGQQPAQAPPRCTKCNRRLFAAAITRPNERVELFKCATPR